MCGIAGYIEKNRSHDYRDAGTVMDAMLNTMYHRGPDAGGKYENQNIVLGHRRLSIVDLSEAGNQPMLSHDGKYIIVFNGEIYNYVELREELCRQRGGVVLKVIRTRK